MAKFFTDPAQLDQVDWKILQARDFKNDPDDPGKIQRYMAEALLWKHVPLAALHGLCCYTREVEAQLKGEAAERDLTFNIAIQTSWYF